MTHVVEVEAIIEPNHTVTVALPDEIPVGPARVTVTIDTGEPTRKFTAKDLLNSEFFGMFADREELPKTNEEFIEWRRKLRDRSSRWS
jgi:hypothetical protein